MILYPPFLSAFVVSYPKPEVSVLGFLVIEACNQHGCLQRFARLKEVDTANHGYGNNFNY